MTDETLKYCPWQLSEHRLHTEMTGLKGKRRTVVKIAITRALEAANDHMTEVEKDPRFKDVKRISKRTNTRLRKLESQISTLRHNAKLEIRKLFPEFKSDTFVTNQLYDNPLLWEENMFKLITEPKITDLSRGLVQLVRDLHKQQNVDEALRRTPCGNTAPTPKAVKSVVKDPNLKAMLDTFTSTLEGE
jgi:hypothetical protein